jgi:tRNA G10  N-methylase Trm11
MEGMLMGYNVIGSDLSEKAIKDSEENIKWLTGKFDVDKSFLKGLFVKDATKISEGDFNVQPDFVVTETYLGPPLSQIPPKNEIEKNFKEIEENVLGTLKRLREKVVVIAVPFYRSGGKKYFLSNLPEKAKKIGYKTDSLFKSEKRGSLLYFRKDQIVGREIFRLKAT